MYGVDRWAHPEDSTYIQYRSVHAIAIACGWLYKQGAHLYRLDVRAGGCQCCILPASDRSVCVVGLHAAKDHRTYNIDWEVISPMPCGGKSTTEDGCRCGWPVLPRCRCRVPEGGLQDLQRGLMTVYPKQPNMYASNPYGEQVMILGDSAPVFHPSPLDLLTRTCESTSDLAW